MINAIGPRNGKEPAEVYSQGVANITSTDIDWTIIRPPLLTDEESTGSYRVAMDSHLNGAKKISRASLAMIMLEAAADDSLIGHVLTVSI